MRCFQKLVFENYTNDYLWIFDVISNDVTMDTLNNLITKSINTMRNVKKEPGFHTIYDILKTDKQPYTINLEDIKER